MTKRNTENERVKRAYLVWLKDARGQSENTLDIAAAAIDRFQAHTGFKPFKTFRREQAVSFKAKLLEAAHPTTGKPLSKATTHGTLKALQSFFEWLSREPGYRKAVLFGDTQYLTPNRNDARIATAERERPFPSLEQVQHTLRRMPANTPLQRRDRALVAFALLSGMRDAAIVSLKLKRLALDRREVFQDARDVATKGAKTFVSNLFPVGVEVETIVREWVEELTKVYLYGPDDPLFPATCIGLNSDGQFEAAGFKREHWKEASPVRAIFRKAFAEAQLPYFYPHSFRRTLMRLAYDLKLGPEEMKAWSQSLGHDSPHTSFSSYGALDRHRQREVMLRIAERGEASPTDNDVDLRAQIQALLDRKG